MSHYWASNGNKRRTSTSFGHMVTPRDSRFYIFVTVALITIAIGSVRSVAGVTCVVAGGPSAQVLGVAIGRVAGVTVVVAGGPSSYIAIGGIARVTSIVGSVGSVAGVTTVITTVSVAGVTIVGGPSVQVVNVASRATGHARLTNIVGGPSVQITNKVRAKPVARSDSCIAYKFHTHQLE
jgi:hypothetical protein